MSHKSVSTVSPFGFQRELPREDRAPATSPSAHRAFTCVLALGMLAVILVGFGPTFFLRAFFDVPAIPGYLILHGAICTTWFALLLVQAQLVRHGNVRLHRRLGIGGAFVAVATVASGVQASLGMIPRRIADGMHLDAAELEFLGIISSANFAFFVVFPTLVLLAIWFRRRPAIHRRLMLVASISIVGPAAMRVSSWFGEIPNPISTIIVFGFLAALIIHDFAAQRRAHVATIASASFAIVVNVGFQLIGVGDAVVGWQMAQGGN